VLQPDHAGVVPGIAPVVIARHEVAERPKATRVRTTDDVDLAVRDEGVLRPVWIVRRMHAGGIHDVAEVEHHHRGIARDGRGPPFDIGAHHRHDGIDVFVGVPGIANDEDDALDGGGTRFRDLRGGQLGQRSRARADTDDACEQQRGRAPHQNGIRTTTGTRTS
jgi:hypothetical protein